jgi:predicted NUDIX family NTP pyrophosphohydrolase
MEWPPRSGKRQEFPEVDRAEWFDVDEAGKKINSGQKILVEELSKIVAHERD